MIYLSKYQDNPASEPVKTEASPSMSLDRACGRIGEVVRKKNYLEKISSCLIIRGLKLGGGLVVLVSLLPVLPPLLFLGIVPTLLIRYLTAKVDHAGVTTGRVFTISSASGIIALPLMGFFVMPKFKEDL